MTTTERQGRPPLAGVREAPFALRADAGDEPNDGYTLDGFGAVFNSETIIDSYEGRFKETIANKSMDRSFRETPPKVQFDHGRHPMIGSIPIARLVSIREDVDPVLAPNGGAHIIARLFDNWLTAPVRDAIEGQAVNGMSFRFSVVRETWAYADGKPIRDDTSLVAELRRCLYEDVPDEELPVRTLKELKVPEVGPVTWPAYSDTSVTVRSQIIDLGRLHEPEQRKLLATAVFLADAAEQDEDAQQDTPKRAVEHPPESDDAQQITGEPVETRPLIDAQRSTDSVGERPSQPKRGHRAVDLMVRKSRDVLLDIQSKGTTP